MAGGNAGRLRTRVLEWAGPSRRGGGLYFFFPTNTKISKMWRANAPMAVIRNNTIGFICQHSVLAATRSQRTFYPQLAPQQKPGQAIAATRIPASRPSMIASASRTIRCTSSSHVGMS